LVVVIGIVRTKLIALLLGPAGFGLMGIYTAIVDLAASVAGMGVGSSGVRQIAESATSGDHVRIARTAAMVRRLSLILGIIGAAILVCAARPVSLLTFGTADHLVAIGVLSLAVLLRIVSAGQTALLQGMRRIGHLAAVNLAGALLGTAATVAAVWWLRMDGIATAIVASAAAGLAASWWYSRRLPIPHAPSPTDGRREEAVQLLSLGFAFMTSGIVMMGAAYAVRTLLLRMEGAEAAGLYQAGWTLGGLYVGFILQAMAADFYPRLVGVIEDHARCNAMVNEQAHVGVLLAGPGVVATLTLAPLVLNLFYSTSFTAATDVLRWVCLGIALRVLTWPMGFIIVAKNRQLIFIGAEVAWAVVNIGLTWALITLFGLTGAGMAFFISYLFHGLMIYPLARMLTGFRWSRRAFRAACVFAGLVALPFLAFQFLPEGAAYALGAVAVLYSAIYSMRALGGLVDGEDIPRPLRRLARAVAPRGRN
jgi:antigen flippase